MSTQHRRTIAKEIVEQTISHFKKQKEGSAVEPAIVQEVKSKPEEKYEPSTSFHKVFSEMIGEKSRESKNPKLSENPRLKNQSRDVDNQSKEEGTMQSVQNLNQKLDLPQPPQKLDEPKSKEENANMPHQPSVFERLSRASIEETPQPKDEEVQEDSHQEIKQEEPAKSTRPVSVFERLSRRAATD